VVNAAGLTDSQVGNLEIVAGVSRFHIGVLAFCHVDANDSVKDSTGWMEHIVGWFGVSLTSSLHFAPGALARYRRPSKKDEPVSDLNQLDSRNKRFRGRTKLK